MPSNTFNMDGMAATPEPADFTLCALGLLLRPRAGLSAGIDSVPKFVSQGLERP